MLQVTLIDPAGSATTLDASAGQTLMEVAVGAGVRGIVGDCGGSAMCATCHVYVDPAWAARLPAPLPVELDMLEGTASERTENSRLGCQIKLGPALDGLLVRLPAQQ